MVLWSRIVAVETVGGELVLKKRNMEVERIVLTDRLHVKIKRSR